MTERKAVALERLLEDERKLILAGQFDGLADVTDRKAAALTELADWKLPAARLSGIAARVSRNQALLDAAIRGIKDARIRIETVIGAAGTLATYDSQGKKADIGQSRTELRKKA